jgi:hypothetical protein
MASADVVRPDVSNGGENKLVSTSVNSIRVENPNSSFSDLAKTLLTMDEVSRTQFLVAYEQYLGNLQKTLIEIKSNGYLLDKQEVYVEIAVTGAAFLGTGLTVLTPAALMLDSSKPAIEAIAKVLTKISKGTIGVGFVLMAIGSYGNQREYNLNKTQIDQLVVSIGNIKDKIAVIRMSVKRPIESKL